MDWVAQNLEEDHKPQSSLGSKFWQTIGSSKTSSGNSVRWNRLIIEVLHKRMGRSLQVKVLDSTRIARLSAHALAPVQDDLPDVYIKWDRCFANSNHRLSD